MELHHHIFSPTEQFTSIMSRSFGLVIEALHLCTPGTWHRHLDNKNFVRYCNGQSIYNGRRGGGGGGRKAILMLFLLVPCRLRSFGKD
jgi:hypothetical protein